MRYKCSNEYSPCSLVSLNFFLDFHPSSFTKELSRLNMSYLRNWLSAWDSSLILDELAITSYPTVFATAWCLRLSQQRYSRLPITWAFRGNRKRFELSTVQLYRNDLKGNEGRYELARVHVINCTWRDACVRQIADSLWPDLAECVIETKSWRKTRVHTFLKIFTETEVWIKF